MAFFYKNDEKFSREKNYFSLIFTFSAFGGIGGHLVDVSYY